MRFGHVWRLLHAAVVGVALAIVPLSGWAEGLYTTLSPTTAPTFERHIMPMLTARGCNGGGCHGKSGGQNGFALSLLGFDPEGDYQSLLMQSRGRRLNLSAPHESLLLQKATGAVPHGGGRRLDPDGEEARLLLEWIAAGGPRDPPGAPRLSRIVISP